MASDSSSSGGAGGGAGARANWHDPRNRPDPLDFYQSEARIYAVFGYSRASIEVIYNVNSNIWKDTSNKCHEKIRFLSEPFDKYLQTKQLPKHLLSLATISSNSFFTAGNLP